MINNFVGSIKRRFSAKPKMLPLQFLALVWYYLKCFFPMTVPSANQYFVKFSNRLIWLTISRFAFRLKLFSQSNSNPNKYHVSHVYNELFLISVFSNFQSTCMHHHRFNLLGYYIQLKVIRTTSNTCIGNTKYKN